MESLFPLFRAETYNDINVSQLLNILSHNKVLILDVRNPDEYFSGHIKNAQNYPLDDIPFKLPQIKPYKKIEVIVYCASGVRSITASQILCENGFEKVYNLIGGISSYKGNLVKK